MPRSSRHWRAPFRRDSSLDCTLLLDLPVAAGLARARARASSGADRFEAETTAFFEKVRAGYLALARANPQRFRIIDATLPLDAVQRRVGEILAGLLAGRVPA